jgi:acetylornithine deacetylase
VRVAPEAAAPGLDWIDANANALVEFASQLVRYDTTCVEPARDERRNDEDACQGFIAARLARLGASVERITPDPQLFSGHQMMPAGHHWDGRAMTLAHLPGSGGGRTLIVNGHIDVVESGPASAWSVPPFGGEVVDGQLLGRGAADMKGGVAAMVFALEALHAQGIRLPGDVWVQIVTDEETNGMGTLALLDEQSLADGAVIPEPSRLAAWVACRGVLYGMATITGRAGHAELPPANWREGGAVNAISKLNALLVAIAELEEKWQTKTHPLLAPPNLVPTLVQGGEFIASFPQECSLTLDATYLLADSDADGFGSLVRHQIEAEIQAALADDPWLVAHPLRWEWSSDYPPYELSGGHDLLASVARALGLLGHGCRLEGLNAWHDAASLGLFAGIPALSCGPGRPEQAHATNEKIAITDLVQGAKFFVQLFLDFCAVQPSTQTETHEPPS